MNSCLTSGRFSELSVFVGLHGALFFHVKIHCIFCMYHSLFTDCQVVDMFGAGAALQIHMHLWWEEEKQSLLELIAFQPGTVRGGNFSLYFCVCLSSFMTFSFLYSQAVIQD